MATKGVFDRCATNWQLMQQLGDDVMTVHIEKLIASPESRLRQLCEFLGLEPDREYLRACSERFFSEPKSTKGSVVWPPELLDDIRRQIEKYPFLHDYADDSEATAA